jgi:glucokinase
MPVLAIDLGGTKLATAVVDSQGRILCSRKAPVVRSSPGATVDQIAAECNSVVTSSGLSWDEISCAGLIVPGVAGSDGCVWAPNLWGDANVPLAAELRHRISAKLIVESDRAGYVTGEQWLGAAQGLDDVVFVAVGTGIGAGILAGGRLIRGAGGAAGAVGWMTLTSRFQESYSSLGAWEAEAAGPALARTAGRISAEAVVEAARDGDPVCRSALQAAADLLGRGIANLVSVFNPEMVVLGGGLMQAGELFLDPVRAVVRKWANPRSASLVRIELSTLGDKAGLLGAARLALSEIS